MYEAIMFLTENFEEVEAIATLDILRRGGVKAASVSITGERVVKGSRDICVTADLIFEELPDVSNAMLILPGGPGTTSYKEHEPLLELLRTHNAHNRPLAAICAAPTIFGMLGFLSDKTAACYPSCEPQLNAAKISKDPTVTDRNITTSKGVGTSINFALELLRLLKGNDEATRIADMILA
ncbi:MAG: DJ-1/PfpI family protein [Defluviitaleaceae bacterium]|nr:DJ-1/PfpI family protein [Defluviitaleaceae bacterium]MCL2262554.1 DJ-1/PfpI family protein [Defluviitaleaceae bacterium]